MREVAQKARADCDSLENQLRNKQIEVEAYEKEIELQRTEKEHLEKRASEVLCLLVAFCGTDSLLTAF